MTGFYISRAIPIDLFEFVGRTWLSETSMEHALDVIKADHGQAWGRVLLYKPWFWWACQQTYQKNALDPYLQIVKDDYKMVQTTLEVICFPLCHEGHWYVVSISLKDQEIQVADGLTRSPPVALVRTIKHFLSQHLNITIDRWGKEYTRISSPQQVDGHSCGPVALAVIESLYSACNYVDWNAADEVAHRIQWIRRCINLHVSTKMASERALSHLQREDPEGQNVLPGCTLANSRTTHPALTDYSLRAIRIQMTQTVYPACPKVDLQMIIQKPSQTYKISTRSTPLSFQRCCSSSNKKLPH